MATETLEYSNERRGSFLRLSWRRVLLCAILAYVMLYLVLRGTGGIAYAWRVNAFTKLTGPAYAQHTWTYKPPPLGAIYWPMMGLEMAARDLVRATALSTNP